MYSTGSLQIARIFNIPVKLHWTFGLLIVGVGFLGLQKGFGIEGTLYFLSFVLGLFLCVVLHEFGHALTARLFGVNTLDIILSPIGGVARLTHLPSKPIQELLIAIAGPMVNVLIAGVIGLVLWFSRENPLLIQGDEASAFLDPVNLLPLMMIINITLVIFNMVPAFPMDGGRVLRALLSMKMGRLRATHIASIVGRVLAVGFVIFGILNGQFILPFIGIFIFMAAAAEYRSVKAEHQLRNLVAEDIYRDQYTLLYEFDSMAHALDRSNRSMEKHFLVTNEQGHLSGVLYADAIQQAVQTNDLHNFISAYKSGNFEAVDVAYPLSYLINLFNEKKYSIVPVYKEGNFVGVIDREAILRKMN